MTTRGWLLIIAVAVLSIAYEPRAAEAQDTLQVNSDSVRLKLENSRVRVLESTLQPGGREQMHSHPPSGVSSKAHAMMSAMGKPITMNRTMSRTPQFGISKNGKTCVAT